MDSQARKAGNAAFKPAIVLLDAFQVFIRKFAAGSYPLFAAAAAALVWANASPASYHSVWHTELGFALGPLQFSRSLSHWINEALMALFFFTVGLEIKRELLVGNLSSPRQAALPITAAAGGMAVPASIYFLFNAGGTGASGWGIPMATDIAFSLGILGLLGRRVPPGLRVFLSAFAIADDLGAVLVIAIFYTPQIVWANLAAAGGVAVVLFLLNRFRVQKAIYYVIPGFVLWAAILGSGVHATIAGVLLAFFIPARGLFDTDTFLRKVESSLEAFACEPGSCGRSILLDSTHQDAVQNIASACQAVETPLQRLEHALESWIAYLVLPLFALANAGLVVRGMDLQAAIGHPVTLGILGGLGIGKPLGITLFALLAVKLFGSELPQQARWSQMIGAGLLGGIGFTMSLFISGLSFGESPTAELSKLGIISASVLCGAAGYAVLRIAGRRAPR